MENSKLRLYIGNKILAGFHGHTLPQKFKQLIHEYKVSNVILFSENISDSCQLKKLCSEIQSEVFSATNRRAFIAVDQEGGMVSRLPSDAVPLSGAMAVAATGKIENAFKVGQITAAQLRSFGINFDLAPSLDVNSNPINPVIGVRSYGEKPDSVALFGTAMMQGLAEGRVLSAIKHFPGHGDTSVDSHVGLPCVMRTEEELMQKEIIPFKYAISSGAQCVMTSHILFPKIEPQSLPATLSHKILTGLLREKLGFNGMIITDCLEMDAISKQYGTAKGAAMAVSAGADMVCISHTPQLAADAAKAIMKAVEDGKISTDMIEASEQRITKLQQQYVLLQPLRITDEDRKYFLRESNKISKESITNVSLGENIYGVNQHTLFISSYANNVTPASELQKGHLNFAEYMAAHTGGKAYISPINPQPQDIQNILRFAEKNEVSHAVVGLYNGQFYEGQIQLIKALVKHQTEVTAVSLRNPYDLGKFTDSVRKIAAYEYTSLAFNSLLQMFDHQFKPNGCLPVTI